MSLHGSARVTDFQCESFEASKMVNRYALYVEPPLELSSKDCFMMIKGAVVKAFDNVESRKCEPGCDTHAVLLCDGQIDFEQK